MCSHWKAVAMNCSEFFSVAQTEEMLKRSKMSPIVVKAIELDLAAALRRALLRCKYIRILHLRKDDDLKEILNAMKTKAANLLESLRLMAKIFHKRRNPSMAPCRVLRFP